METIIAYTYGGSRGNPGPAAAGVYVTNTSGEIVSQVKESLGNATSSFAEYYAVMLALQTLEQLYGDTCKEMQFEIRLDSELVKTQLSNETQIKEPGLVPMFIEIHNMRVEMFPHIFFTQITKEENTEAINLITQILDGK